MKRIREKDYKNDNSYDEFKKEDIMEGGELSGAFFVSAITTMFNLTKEMHATVDHVVKDLAESGWTEIQEPRKGAIVVWEKQKFGNEEHKQIGFYVGDDEAISNSSAEKVPTKHDLTFGGKRKVTDYFWNEKLD